MNRKKKYKDETGIKYGFLLPVRYIRTDLYRGAMFECVCDCGNVVERSGGELRSRGNSNSCGCKRKQPRKPKATECVVCGQDVPMIAKNMCRKCYTKQREERLKEEMERYL